MQIYKTINKVNRKWYIGKDQSNRSYYYGSGRILKNAIKKYGKHNFEKIIIEECSSIAELCEREIYWIKITNALTDPMSYNLASGGEGGDLSKYINYKKRGYKGDRFAGAKKWFNSLTESEKQEWHAKQAKKRSKVWYVSRVDVPEIEIRIVNINQWSKDNNCEGIAQTSCKTNPCYGKSIKGWRCRRENDLNYPSFVDKRKIGHENVACKGKTWKIIDGKRVWFDKP